MSNFYKLSLSGLLLLSINTIFTAEQNSLWEQVKRALGTARDVTYGTLLRKTGIRYVTPKQVNEALNKPKEFDRFIRKYGQDVTVAESQLQRFKGAGTPLLVYAILSRHKNSRELATQLIERGAKLHSGKKDHDPLTNAIYAGRPEILSLLLRKGAPLSEGVLQIAFEGGNQEIINALLREMQATGVLFDSFVPIHAAVKAGNRKIVKYLLGAGVHVAVADKVGNTPLHIAAHKGYSDIVMLLLNNGADINAHNDRNETPLHWADARITELLVAQGVNVDSFDTAGDTPLFKAVRSNQPDKMRALVKAGANVLHKNVRGNSLLHQAIPHPALALALLESVPIEVNHQNASGDSALHMAALQKSKPLVEALLTKGALANVQNVLGITPLLYAIKNGQTDIVELLLKHGANINIADRNHNSSLHYAFIEGASNRELIELLLRHGARVDVRNDTGKTPLHYAVKESSWHTIAPLFLYSTESTINLQDHNGNTILHEALLSYRPDLTIIRALRQHGALIDVKNIHSETPLHQAASLNNPDIVRELLDTHRIFDIDVRDRDGFTPFHRAIVNNDLATAKLLRTRGANINTRNNAGNAPLHSAKRNKIIVDYLLANGADPTIRNYWGRLAQSIEDKKEREEQEKRRKKEEKRKKEEERQRAQQEQERLKKEKEEAERAYPQMKPFEPSVPAPPTQIPSQLPSAPPMEPEEVDPFAGASAPPEEE